MLIKGERLNEEQRKQVLASFEYRWTSDNSRREAFWASVKGKPTMPLVTDDQWLKEHAFYFTKAGKLQLRPKYCEPVYMAD